MSTLGCATVVADRTRHQSDRCLSTAAGCWTECRLRHQYDRNRQKCGTECPGTAMTSRSLLESSSTDRGASPLRGQTCIQASLRAQRGRLPMTAKSTDAAMHRQHSWVPRTECLQPGVGGSAYSSLSRLRNGDAMVDDAVDSCYPSLRFDISASLR